MSSVPSGLPESISIYADRTVSTTSARLVQGIEPLIRDAYGRGYKQAYLARETIASRTGLSHSRIIEGHYDRQVSEVGVVDKVSEGRFEIVDRKGGGRRGVACGWRIDWSGWTPKDIPVMDLVTAPYKVSVDTDRETVTRAMDPVNATWAKETRAHRLACALLHHAGFRRVLLTPKLAAEILGTGLVTGWKALKDLVRLRLAKVTEEGTWVDLSVLLYIAQDLEPAPEVARQREEHELIRDTVMKRSKWDIRTHARMCRQVLARAQEQGHVVRADYAAVVGRSFRQALLYVARDVRDNQWTWGRPVEI